MFRLARVFTTASFVHNTGLDVETARLDYGSGKEVRQALCAHLGQRTVTVCGARLDVECILCGISCDLIPFNLEFSFADQRGGHLVLRHHRGHHTRLAILFVRLSESAVSTLGISTIVHLDV